MWDGTFFFKYSQFCIYSYFCYWRVLHDILKCFVCIRVCVFSMNEYLRNMRAGKQIVLVVMVVAARPACVWLRPITLIYMCVWNIFCIYYFISNIISIWMWYGKYVFYKMSGKMDLINYALFADESGGDRAPHRLQWINNNHKINRVTLKKQKNKV